MESQARTLAAGLVHAGCEMLIVTRRTDPAWKKIDDVDGIPVYRAPPSGTNSRLRWAMLLTGLPALARRRKEYDILFVSGFRALGIAAVLAGACLRKKVVLKADSRGEMSGDFFAGGLKQMKIRGTMWPVRMLMKLRNRILRRADTFVSLSSEMTAEYQAARAPADRIVLIANAVDTERFRPATSDEKAGLRDKLGLPQNVPLVIFTGRIVAYKGVPSLVRVWDQLAPKHAGARLILAGSGSSDIFNCEEEIREYVRAHGLSEQVLLTGAIANVHEYLRACDIYAFPSENEAFPLALIEAMACGLPVVSTLVGGIRDVIVPDQNGLAIEAGSQDQLKKALEQMLADAALRENLGQAGLKTIQARYTRDIVTKQYVALFNRCSGRPG
jgi:glycosyltransferase involved in cell wall biosynthesis